MKYGEAFAKLGYTLGAPRTDWSAQNEQGVCLTLWRSEIDWTAKPLTMDTRLRGGRLEDWERKPGNIKRRAHIAHAIEHHANWVDVIIVDGNSQSGVEKATPWNPIERQNLRWRVVDFEADTGHFAFRRYRQADGHRSQSVRPELVEGLSFLKIKTGLRQAQPERAGWVCSASRGTILA